MDESLRLADLEIENKKAVVFVNAAGLVTRVNQKFEQLFGWFSAEILGRPLSVIIPPAFRDLHQAGFSRLLATNEPRLLGQTVRLKAIDKKGREFMAEHLILGERRGGVWVFGASIQEVMPL